MQMYNQHGGNRFAVIFHAMTLQYMYEKISSQVIVQLEVKFFITECEYSLSYIYSRRFEFLESNFKLGVDCPRRSTLRIAVLFHRNQRCSNHIVPRSELNNIAQKGHIYGNCKMNMNTPCVEKELHCTRFHLVCQSTANLLIQTEVDSKGLIMHTGT